MTTKTATDVLSVSANPAEQGCCGGKGAPISGADAAALAPHDHDEPQMASKAGGSSCCCGTTKDKRQAEAKKSDCCG